VTLSINASPDKPYLGHRAASGRWGEPRVRFTGNTEMGEYRLAILPHVTSDARPTARNFEPAPSPGWHLFGPPAGWLPLPEAVQTEPLRGSQWLATCLANVPDGRDENQNQNFRAASKLNLLRQICNCIPELLVSRIALQPLTGSADKSTSLVGCRGFATHRADGGMKAQTVVNGRGGFVGFVLRIPARCAGSPANSESAVLPFPEIGVARRNRRACRRA
jgi:hypothetical protein